MQNLGRPRVRLHLAGVTVTNPNPGVFDVDCVVYSSHKSGTQSLMKTLRASGLCCLHLHCLYNVGLEPGNGALRSCLEAYTAKYGRPVTVLSCFRLPMERHFSSFFQWHGTGVLNQGVFPSEHETIIARYSLEELRHVFVEELHDRTLVGYDESLHELCSEIGLGTRDLDFTPETGMTRIDTPLCRLYLLRFDLLFKTYPNTLERISRSL